MIYIPSLRWQLWKSNVLYLWKYCTYIFNIILVLLIFEMPPRNNQHKVPDLSPLDYWFWSVCLVELRKNPSNSLPELVYTVAKYAASLNKDQIITAVNDMLPRAQACIASDGEAFKYELKYFKKRHVNFFPLMSNIIRQYN